MAVEASIPSGPRSYLFAVVLHAEDGRLLDRYGPQYWWPAKTPFEIMVGAVLTQATAWTNVEKAISNLGRADALTPGAIRAMTSTELARLVYSSGFFNAKAHKLKALCQYLGRAHDDDIEAMSRLETAMIRGELLGVFGIGEETADAILLYALEHPVFVIDAYSRRTFGRLGLATDLASYTTTSLFSRRTSPSTRPCSASTTR